MERDTSLRFIPSLREILVRIFPKSHFHRPRWNLYSDFMEREMERLEWRFEMDMGNFSAFYGGDIEAMGYGWPTCEFSGR